MDLGPFRFGLRTFKTVIAVAICIFIFSFQEEHLPTIACLSAIVALREDMSKTYSFGGFRVLGTLIGSFASFLYYFLQQAIGHDRLVEIIFIPLCVGLIIIISDGFNFNKGIIASNATFLLIVFTIPKNEAWLYIAERTLDSIIGVVIALLVNRLIAPPNTPQEELETAPSNEELELKVEELLQENERLKNKLTEKDPK